MRKAFFFFVIACTFLFTNVHAQIGIGTNTPDPAAMLEVSSSNKGLLIPRVALTGINDVTTIPSAPASLLVYNTATAGAAGLEVIPGYYYWNGTLWLNLVTYSLQQNINANGKFLSGDGTNTGILLSANGTMVGSGGFNTGPDLTGSYMGANLMWYPKKAAFWAGSAGSIPWTSAAIGTYSASFGNGSVASGTESFAAGYEAIAGGPGSFATGNMTAALGSSSVSMGNGTIASGATSVAIGSGSIASATGSIAIGNGNEANGEKSFALGNAVSTNGHNGSFIFGDNSTPLFTGNTLPNQMLTRFINGYEFRGIPNTAFTMTGGGTIVSNGDFNTGEYLVPAGTGARLIWSPAKAAFRAGFAESTSWNDANIGNYSAALGQGTVASGNNSTAFGEGSRAEGSQSTAMGNTTIASGQAAVSMGSLSSAAGDYATSMGFSTQANGEAATAMGYFTFANNLAALATGYTTQAMASYSTAMGSNVTVNSAHTGSFIIGDANSPATATASSTTNEMTMRFENGYRLLSNAAGTVGVKVNPGDNAWSVLSDANLKENFVAIDGEDFLKRLGTIPTTTWNYKGQDPNHHRHYGPMAQDFYKAFGRDSYGTIGNNTSINQADFDGVNFTAIQALVNRTNRLQEGNRQQLSKIDNLEQRIKQLEKMLEKKNTTN
jgi:hypothetical protein